MYYTLLKVKSQKYKVRNSLASEERPVKHEKMGVGPSQGSDADAMSPFTHDGTLSPSGAITPVYDVHSPNSAPPPMNRHHTSNSQLLSPSAASSVALTSSHRTSECASPHNLSREGSGSQGTRNIGSFMESDRTIFESDSALDKDDSFLHETQKKKKSSIGIHVHTKGSQSGMAFSRTFGTKKTFGTSSPRKKVEEEENIFTAQRKKTISPHQRRPHLKSAEKNSSEIASHTHEVAKVVLVPKKAVLAAEAAKQKKKS